MRNEQVDGGMGDFDADLKTLDLERLRLQWRNLSGKAASPGLTRSLLQRLIAYQRQVARLGDLSPGTRKVLARIAAGAAADREALTVDGRPSATPAVTSDRKTRSTELVAKATGSDRKHLPGTILVREWQGTLQRVTVLKEGFAWNGTTYRSLSRVAREITGINWNGHVFFGGGGAKVAGGKTARGKTSGRKAQSEEAGGQERPVSQRGSYQQAESKDDRQLARGMGAPQAASLGELS